MTTDYDWFAENGAPLPLGSAHSVSGDEIPEDELPQRGRIGFTFYSSEEREQDGVREITSVKMLSASLDLSITPAHDYLQEIVGRKLAAMYERQVAKPSDKQT